jgi:thiol:disulfide interchange protein
MRKFAVVVALLSLSSLAWAGRAQLAHRSPQPLEAKPVPSQPEAITWYEYEDALALAKKDDKAVLVEFRAEWCHWCQKMEKEVYTDREVIALSDRVVFARVDEAKRKDLLQKYGVRGLPTAVVLDRNGREIGRIVGYKAAKEFAAEIRQALSK